MTFRRPVAVVGVAVAAATAVLLYSYDPASLSGLPLCPLRALTGLLCPLCGGLRAAHALMHGRMLEAVALNPFLFAAGSLGPFLPVRWTMAGAVLFMAGRNLG
jgi:hypothetical protein